MSDLGAEQGAAMLSQTALGAVIATLCRPLTWANTATWSVRLTAHRVRDEEAAGSNPATSTEKFQADGMIVGRDGHATDHLLAIRGRDRTRSRCAIPVDHGHLSSGSRATVCGRGPVGGRQ